jgi:hypothetical protein
LRAKVHVGDELLQITSTKLTLRRLLLLFILERERGERERERRGAHGGPSSPESSRKRALGGGCPAGQHR